MKSSKPFSTAALLHEPKTAIVRYNSRDSILYALSIGCSVEEVNARYVNELHPSFDVFPTFPSVLIFKGAATDVLPFPSPTMEAISQIPQLPLHAKMKNRQVIIDYERQIDVLGSLPKMTVGGQPVELTLKNEIVGVEARKTGALVTAETIVSHKGRPVYRIRSGSIMIGAENFQTSGSNCDELAGSVDIKALDGVNVPTAVQTVTVPNNSALLYRLNGDYNQLHASQAIARSSGFPAPILHGLCTMAIGVRVVMGVFGGKYRRSRAKFQKPVFPGQSLAVEMYDQGVLKFESSHVRVIKFDVILKPGRGGKKAYAVRGAVVHFDCEASFLKSSNRIASSRL